MAQGGVGVGDGVGQIPNQAKIKLSLSNQIKSNQIKSNQIKSNQIKSYQSPTIHDSILRKNKQEKGIDDPK